MARTRILVALAALTVAVVAALVLGGCGAGPGPGTADVSLVVTQAFGTRRLGSVTTTHVPGSETVMRMLERHFRVTTRYGGGFVESIDGHSGTPGHTDWFYYVNGIEAPRGAATTAVHRGDRIWWDLHDWRATDSIPAVVGAFPEPFVHGTGGRRLPTTIECGQGLAAACKTVTTALGRAGVPVAEQLLGAGSGSDTLNVVVGTWAQIRSEVAGALVAHGPSASGVYARFTGAGLALLNPAGRAAESLGAGTGLIAATADQNSVPTWLVTGTDAAGVRAAAAAFTPAALDGHFALAVHGGDRIPLPVDATQ